MRKNSSEFVTSFTSEAGTFRINKDYFAYAEMDDIACYIVADGIDSDEDINSAELVVNFLFENLLTKPNMSRRKLKRYIIEAHRLLNEKSRSVRLKTSLIVMLTNYSKIIYATAGNTRLYHFRNGGLNFKSKDQSIAQMMANAGKISEEEIAIDDERNNLTNYLGQAKRFKPFVSKAYKLNDKDVIVLGTVGFWENIQSIDLVNALKDSKEPADLIEILEDELLSRQNKVVNNYTIAAIYANKVFKENINDDLRLKIAKKIAMILIPIVIIATGFFVFNRIQRVKARELFVKLEKNGDEFMGDDNYEKAFENYEEAFQSVKKVYDKDSEERIQIKSRIASLIVEGDSFLRDREFEKAKKSYINARTKVELELREEKKELENKIDEKIERTKDFITVFNRSVDGDKEAAKGEDLSAKANQTEDNKAKIGFLNEAKQYYSNAIEIYDDAKGLSEKISYYDMIEKMEEKIKQTKGKIEKLDAGVKEASGAIDKEDKTKELVKKAESYKDNGDKKSRTGRYEDAKIDYRYALNIYEELSEKYDQDTTEKRSDIERRLLDIEKKIEEKEKSINQEKTNEGMN